MGPFTIPSITNFGRRRRERGRRRGRGRGTEGELRRRSKLGHRARGVFGANLGNLLDGLAADGGRRAREIVEKLSLVRVGDVLLTDDFVAGLDDQRRVLLDGSLELRVCIGRGFC